MIGGTIVTTLHRFGVSTKTIAKWKSRDFVKDKTSRPKTIHYALNETEREIICSRKKVNMLRQLPP
jgi:hypothetical protein